MDLESLLKLDTVIYDHLKIVESENSELKRLVFYQHDNLVSVS